MTSPDISNNGDLETGVLFLIKEYDMVIVLCIYSTGIFLSQCR